MLTLQLDVMILMFTLFTISTALTFPSKVRHNRIKYSISLLRSSSNDIEVTTRRKMLLDESIKASTVATSILYHYPNPVYAAETKACDPGDTRCRQGGVLGEEPKGKNCSLYEIIWG